VSVTQVTVDPAAANDVVEGVGVREGEAPEDAQMGLDQVQPGRLCGSPDGPDVKPSEQSLEAGVIVRLAQVVYDHEESFAGVAGPQTAEGVEEVGRALLFSEDPAETVAQADC
jgi:hypothetical protein